MSRLAAIIFATLLVLSYAGESPSAAAPTKVVLAYGALNARLAPLWTAQEQGFFTKYGVDTELVLVRSASPLIAGLTSGDVHVGYGGGSAALGAAAAGLDLKILATFTSRITYDLVVRPGIKTPKDLRGKRLGVTSIGGTGWMGAMLWLEHLGLDERQDDIRIQVVGDQPVLAQALEAGTIEATVLDGVFSQRLKQKGFPILGEFHQVNQRLMGQAVVVKGAYLQQHPDTLENLLKAQIEGLAFVFSPRSKPAVLNTLTNRLRISDPAVLEEGYQDIFRFVDRKPYPSLEGLRNVQRLMKTRNARVANIKTEDLIDSRFLRKLDESGFIDRLYSTYGTK